MAGFIDAHVILEAYVRMQCARCCLEPLELRFAEDAAILFYDDIRYIELMFRRER